tara:strand:+ start:152 stop:532 length:381 start_codon:yes stop_codon:yes gene_type:complete
MEIDTVSYMKFLAALIFVLGLIGGFALVAKKMGLGNRGPVKRGRGKRLSIIESITLDAKRRVVLIGRDDKEHLLLIGAASEQVIETDIPSDENEADDTESSAKTAPFRKPTFLRALQDNTNAAGDG